MVWLKRTGIEAVANHECVWVVRLLLINLLAFLGLFGYDTKLGARLGNLGLLFSLVMLTALALCLNVADAAFAWASSHLDLPSSPIDLRVVLNEPWMTN